MSAKSQHISEVTLDERSIVRWSPEVEHERNVAIFDLLEENHFAPIGLAPGPYDLHLSIVENRLHFDIRSKEGKELSRVTLSMSPVRKLIRDAASTDYRWSSLLLGIVESLPFQMRRVSTPVDDRLPTPSTVAQR